jgi:hypothetical protein
MKIQIKIIFLFSVMLLHITIYTCQDENIPLATSILSASLTHPIPSERITTSEYINLIVTQTEALKEKPTLKKLAALIEIFQEARTNAKLLPEIIGREIFQKGPQSTYYILGSLVASHMNNYFETIQAKNLTILTRTTLLLRSIQYTKQNQQDVPNSFLKQIAQKNAAFNLSMSRNNNTVFADPHNILSMHINNLLQKDKQTLELMAKMLYCSNEDNSSS